MKLHLGSRCVGLASHGAKRKLTQDWTHRPCWFHVGFCLWTDPAPPLWTFSCLSLLPKSWGSGGTGFCRTKRPVLKVGSECESWFTQICAGVWSVSLLLWSCFILGLGETASVSLLQDLKLGFLLPSSSLSFSLFFHFLLLSFSLSFPTLSSLFPTLLHSSLPLLSVPSFFPLHHPPFLRSFLLWHIKIYTD